MCLLVEENGSAQLPTKVNDPKYKKAVAIGTEAMVPLTFWPRPTISKGPLAGNRKSFRRAHVIPGRNGEHREDTEKIDEPEWCA